MIFMDEVEKNLLGSDVHNAFLAALSRTINSNMSKTVNEQLKKEGNTATKVDIILNTAAQGCIDLLARLPSEEKGKRITSTDQQHVVNGRDAPGSIFPTLLKNGKTVLTFLAIVIRLPVDELIIIGHNLRLCVQECGSAGSQYSSIRYHNYVVCNEVQNRFMF